MNWIKESNRPKHLFYGAILGLFVATLFCLLTTILIGLFLSTVTTLLVAAALEFKDWQHGGKFDWLDLAATEIGAMASKLVVMVILIFM